MSRILYLPVAHRWLVDHSDRVLVLGFVDLPLGIKPNTMHYPRSYAVCSTYYAAVCCGPLIILFCSVLE